MERKFKAEEEVSKSDTKHSQTFYEVYSLDDSFLQLSASTQCSEFSSLLFSLSIAVTNLEILHHFVVS